MSSADQDRRAPAVLFDLDGTLVDSNYLHVHAWQRAFTEAGLAVESWRIHRCIGMDGGRLLESLIGDEDDDTQGRAKELHTRYYAETAALLRLLPGSREVLDKVRAAGLQVVLATSAPENELAMLREVLDAEDIVSAVTSSEDVGTAKPEPDIVGVALERAGVDAHRAVFVGDAVWDVEACERAGLPAIALLSGGVSRGELDTAGARATYENPAELLQHFDDSPIGALVSAAAH